MPTKKNVNNHVTKYFPISSCIVLRSFVIGLVGATVTGVTTHWWNQLVDIVGTAVFYFNVERVFAAISSLVKADFF